MVSDESGNGKRFSGVLSFGSGLTFPETLYWLLCSPVLDAGAMASGPSETISVSDSSRVLRTGIREVPESGAGETGLN